MPYSDIMAPPNNTLCNDPLSRTTYDQYLLFIAMCITSMCICVFKRQYQKTFVVDTTLVLLIDNTKPEIVNIKDLAHLWDNNYNYDVFINKRNTLQCTKREIKCVIVHCISHGDTDSFLCSDGKKLSLDFIRHELGDVET
eukprot:775908_1